MDMRDAKLGLRRLAINLAVLLLAVFITAGARADALTDFARQVGLQDVAGFVETIRSLDRDRKLPARYATKDEAQRLGWSPGKDLWAVAPGRSIGGDRFGNRERLLPMTSGRRFFEADLDYRGGRRGAKRLVWSSDGLRWVTTDHYRSFHEVPR
jgi:ribonuclease T1